MTTDYPAPVVEYPASTVDQYRKAGLWGTLTMGEELRRTAWAHPDREAVVTAETRLTYAELNASTDALAAGFHEAGLRIGDRVLLQLGNRAEAVEIFYGLLKAGLVPICTLLQHGPHELDAITAISEARGHIIDLTAGRADLEEIASSVRDQAPSLAVTIAVGRPESLDVTPLEALRCSATHVIEQTREEVQRAVGPDDVAVLQLSGGTTGTPKLIPRRHAEYWYNGRATGERWGVTKHDRIAHFLPIVHNAGIHAALLPAHAAGACLVLGTWSAEQSAAMMAAERVTGMFLIAHLGAELMRTSACREAVSELRWLSLSGAKVPPEIIDGLESMGVPVVQNFGMSEGIVFAMPPAAVSSMRHQTVGYPLSELDEVRLLNLDDSQTEVSMGEPGELCVRGPYTIRGYFSAPEHNSRAFSEDGFYRTGDVMSRVEIDGHVCYQVEGRIKDLINRGGEKINAEEVEAVLRAIPGVDSAAVVAMPDPRLGERACAYLVPDGSGHVVGLAEVRETFAARGVAKYKWPERVELIDQIPTTHVGKIAKKALRDDIATKCAAEAAETTGAGS